jgi:hypothetical protein
MAHFSEGLVKHQAVLIWPCSLSPCDFGHRVGETTAVLPGERWCSGNSRGGHLWSARIVTVGWRVPIYSGIYTIYIIYSPDTIYIYSPDIPYHFIPIYNYIQYMIYVPMVSTFFRTSWTLPQWWSMHDVSATLGGVHEKVFFWCSHQRPTSSQCGPKSWTTPGLPGYHRVSPSASHWGFGTLKVLVP